ncbi:hypothetical protein BD779DRAFT_430702 [Infundibulicybe gibba]|nr:hypothetical protein BD779DRAFT_430702 [Infundibulicybe gibba]
MSRGISFIPKVVRTISVTFLRSWSSVDSLISAFGVSRGEGKLLLPHRLGDNVGVSVSSILFLATSGVSDEKRPRVSKSVLRVVPSRTSCSPGILRCKARLSISRPISTAVRESRPTSTSFKMMMISNWQMEHKGGLQDGPQGDGRYPASFG